MVTTSTIQPEKKLNDYGPLFSENDEAQNPDLDYLLVLKAIKEVGRNRRFNMGRKLLIEFLKGNQSHKSIQRNSLHKIKYFGSLAHIDKEIECMIDSLLLNDLIVQRPIKHNSFSKVFELTNKGNKEIANPTLYKKKLAFNFKAVKTQITKEDLEMFKKFDSFIPRFNDEQKKAVLSENSHVLCVAGAGSGKTTVLTKRIEFLIKHRSVDPRKILAITFTRKARKEMMSRLVKAGIQGSISVETFNSFSEKILRAHGSIFYGREVRVLSFGKRISMVNKILADMKKDMESAIHTYFTPAQMRGKSDEQLSYIFMNDCFFIRDYFKSQGKTIDQKSFFSANVINNESTRLVFGVCRGIEEQMERYGLRDFADQLVDAIALFRKHKELIPHFDHVLVDEYQDVNSAQIELLELLSPPNLFCVGDPRQSIFGWRGSDIRHILDFEEKYPGCEIVTLTKNYRSTKHIVNLMNHSIKNMGLADIESSIEGEHNLQLQELLDEEDEFGFVIKSILTAEPSESIFVLARTNRQLNEISEKMERKGIKHSIRSDERKIQPRMQDSNVTLATIHAIKGMEADSVFVIGCTQQNFPIRASEHPIVDMIKSDDYDKEEEERRLFYVAMSRARAKLYLTYATAKSTRFINETMLDLLKTDKPTPTLKSQPEPGVHPLPSTTSSASSQDLAVQLKKWRFSMSAKRSVPAYMIFNNRTLEGLAQQRPTSIEGLHKIHGLGPAKISEFGEEILKIISANTSKTEPKIESETIDTTNELLAKLQKVRADLAGLYKCNPHNIFSDSVLIGFAKQKPSSKEEMTKVPGTEEATDFEKFAEPFLNTISEHVQENDKQSP